MSAQPKIKNLLSLNFYYNFFKKHATLIDLFTTLIYIIFAVTQLTQLYYTQTITNLFYFTAINMFFMTIMIFYRNKAPILSLCGALIIPLVLTMLRTLLLGELSLQNIKLPLFVSTSILEPIALTILLYTVGTKSSIKTTLLCTTVVSTIVTALEIFSNETLINNYSQLIITITIFIIATLIGITVQFHTSRVIQLEHLYKQLELERKQHEQLIISTERTRIAREMHDIVAHSLAIVITMADGAEAMIEKNPELAKQAINQIGQTGRSALNETRRLVGILRENVTVNIENKEEISEEKTTKPTSSLNQIIQKTGILQSNKNNKINKNFDESETENTENKNINEDTLKEQYAKTIQEKAPLTPQPDSQTIESLIKEFKNAGLPITYTYTGKAIENNTALGLTIYRILQEALTNILRYAPFSPSVTIKINRFYGGITIIIKNLAGASTSLMKGSGKGIIGMRERAAVYDGYVEAGPTENGWQVKAFLRLDDGGGESTSWTAPN